MIDLEFILVGGTLAVISFAVAFGVGAATYYIRRWLNQH